jgi:hypothetical protein
VLQAGVYSQCIIYGHKHAHLIPELCNYFVTVSLGVVVVVTITFWTFIVYYPTTT